MKMHIPLKKPQPWVWPATIVCLCFGGFIAFLVGAVNQDVNNVDTSKMNREQLIALYGKAQQDNLAQQQELEDLRTQLNEFTDTAMSDQKLKDFLQQQLDELRVRAGSTAVKGPGIFITLDDTGNLKSNPVNPSTNLNVVHDSDLYVLVNELRAAGAEAIDINGLRVTGNTAIRCSGPVIQVNNSKVAQPFHIQAIGKPDTLYGAVNMPGGNFEWLRSMGIRVEVSKRDNLLIPAMKNVPRMEFGKPVLDEKDATEHP